MTDILDNRWNHNPTQKDKAKEKQKEEEEESKTISSNIYIKFSFYITYVLLITTGTITIIEAVSTNDPFIRHVMNIETCISIIAGYFYSNFIHKIDDFNTQHIPIDWLDITKTRYTDWCITTPLMLLVLCLVTGHNTKVPIQLHIIAFIWVLNYLMMFFGFMGETGMMDKWAAMGLGFIPFFMMLYVIFYTYIRPKYVTDNYILFFFYAFIWSLYGVVYMLSDIYKNIILNILDCISKCFVGIALWSYYTKIIRMS